MRRTTEQKSLREIAENRGRRTLAALWSGWLDALHRRCYSKLMRMKYSDCFRCAERICMIGFDNPPEIQKHLSTAKDELYAAALRFKAEADKI